MFLRILQLRGLASGPDFIYLGILFLVLVLPKVCWTSLGTVSGQESISLPMQSGENLVQGRRIDGPTMTFRVTSYQKGGSQLFSIFRLAFLVHVCWYYEVLIAIVMRLLICC